MPRCWAVKFGDNDVEAWVNTAARLCWTSRLRGPRFAQFVTLARGVTHARILLGRVERGDPDEGGQKRLRQA
jgi:hypothetical protein